MQEGKEGDGRAVWNAGKHPTLIKYNKYCAKQMPGASFVPVPQVTKLDRILRPNWVGICTIAPANTGTAPDRQRWFD